MIKPIILILFSNSLVLCSSLGLVNDSIDSSEDNYTNKDVLDEKESFENEEVELEILEVDLNEDGESTTTDPNNDSDGLNSNITVMTSALHKIGRKYYCTAKVPDKSYLLMYGTKAWRFPQQRVNLTLTYPSEHDEMNNDAYLITEFELLVYINGGRTRAYLTSGAVMKETISLFIVSEGISYLSYQLSLYGIPKATFFRKGRFYYHCG